MSVETLGIMPESSIDVREAQRLLGYEVQPSFGLGIEYDERLAVCEAALAAKETMRANLQAAAEGAGLEVSREEIDAWEPSEWQLGQIRHSLLRERKRARMLDGMSQFVDDGRLEGNAFGTPLWSNQQQMFMDTEAFLVSMARTYEKGGKGGVISGPPGCGKTGVISALCAGLKYNEAPDERLKIVILENTQNVMHQTHGRAGDRGFGKFAPHLDVGLRYQGLKDLDHDIVIMPFASFNLLMERGEMPDCDVVIGDEGDVYCVGQTGENLRKYVADKTYVILTATPDEATYDLAPHDIYSMGLPQGIHDGLLAPTTGLVLRIPGVDENTPRADYLRACIEDAKPRIQRAVQDGVSVLVHCPAGGDIEIARTLASELRDLEIRVPNPLDGTWPDYFKTIPRNIRAIAVGGKKQASVTGKRLQQVIYSQYNTADIDVLVFVQAIGRGDDFPGAKLLVELESQTENAWRGYVQRGGRVTRLIKDRLGKPVPATWISYHDPSMSSQYTSVMALGGDAGQDVIRVSQQRTVSSLPQRKLRPRLLADATAMPVVEAETVDTIHVEHKVSGESAELPPLGARALARYLLVSEVTMTQIFGREGMAPDDTLDAEGVELLLEYYPHLRPEALPETGYISAVDLMALLGRTDVQDVRRLRYLAGRHNIEFRRFKAQGGDPEFYLTDDDANRLLQALNRPAA